MPASSPVEEVVVDVDGEEDEGDEGEGEWWLMWRVVGLGGWRGLSSMESVERERRW